jgi:hypothetical protein
MQEVKGCRKSLGKSLNIQFIFEIAKLLYLPRGMHSHHSTCTITIRFCISDQILNLARLLSNRFLISAPVNARPVPCTY